MQTAHAAGSQCSQCYQDYIQNRYRLVWLKDASRLLALYQESMGPSFLHGNF
ncbi:hypothetical protein BDV29DRAFT_180156 [Aspergillus leporis]|uniref:Uncharacterized protein n=1 Tax=Aspergillus leporis TaxID=41062 RepID=A0A5N5WUD6_9EURO|nr:hypothetical protein BDV29DRAFT_180156 [Aspergillus leporis]